MALSGARTGANLANGVMTPEKYSTLMQVDFKRASVVQAISNTDWQGEISEGTDKVIIRTVPEVTISSYAINGEVEIQDLSMGTVELKIDQQDSYAYQLSMIDTRQSNLALAQKIVENATYKMKKTVDEKVLQSLPASIALSNTVGTAIGNSTPLQLTAANSLQMIFNASQVLEQNDIPPSDRWGVISPYYANLLKQGPLGQTYITGDATSPIRNGLIGEINGMKIYSSTALTNALAPLVGSPTNLLFGHKSALTFAFQFMLHDETKMERRFSILYKGLNVWGWKAVQPKGLVLGLVY